MTPDYLPLGSDQKFAVEKDLFRIPYNRRFQEGEFRKRVQFMYGGPLQRVTFTYTGSDIDAVFGPPADG